jgi:anti-sigma B factor antagonist
MSALHVEADSEGVIWLSGEIDLATADAFSDDALRLDGQRSLVLDVSRVTFLDSSGLRAILALGDRVPTGVVLRNPPPVVRRVLAITGVVGASRVTIEP